MFLSTSGDQASSQAADRLAAVGAWLDRIPLALAGAALALIVVMVTSDIITRSAGYSLLFANEYGEYLMAASVFLALPAVTLARAHLAAEFLVVRCGPRTRTLLRLLSDIVLFVYALALFGIALRMVWVSYAQGLRSQGLMMTPLFVPQTAMLLGLLLFVLCAGLQAAIAIRGAARPAPAGEEIKR